jgi:hypothetical protein
MTNEDARSQLERDPFIPIRIHLVSGKTIDVTMPGAAWMLKNAVMVLHDPRGAVSALHDVIALRNIERLEQLEPQVEQNDHGTTGH